MGLVIETQRGNTFIVEVWYFDTVLGIKQKIQNLRGIPVSMQTLIFNGQTLPDDANTDEYVGYKSRVQLLIADDFFKTTMPVGKTKEEKEFSPAPPSTVKLLVDVKTSSSKIYTLEMDAKDTVSKLKERIQEIEAVPMNKNIRLVVHLAGNELHDHHHSCQDASSSKKKKKKKTSDGCGCAIQEVLSFIIKRLKFRSRFGLSLFHGISNFVNKVED